MLEGRKKQFRVERENQFLKSLYRVLIVLVAGAALILGVAIFIPQHAKLMELHRQANILDIKLRDQQELLEKRKREIHLLENDPEYIEIVARDVGDGLMKPGETIFRIRTASAD